ncbi:MAG TPA: HEPN domain-containing protein [Thermoanaerobaculia bacterium]|nr:HEPN domain-containing protein [Thermoanaerobaculia bacterium]
MASRTQLKELALLRLREAKYLFEGGFYDGARYLAGYVLELALKARICRVLDMEEYPDTGELRRVYATHDLDQLLKLSGLNRKLAIATKTFDRWSIAAQWKPEYRYSSEGTTNAQDAERILSATGNPSDGVLTWIKKYW